MRGCYHAPPSWSTQRKMCSLAHPDKHLISRLHPKEMAEKKLTESKHCHGPVTLRFSGEPPASGMNPCLCWFVQPHGPCWTTGVRRHLQHLWQTCVRQRNPFKRCLQSTSNSFDTVPGTGEPHVGRGRQVLSKFNRPPVRK